MAELAESHSDNSIHFISTVAGRAKVTYNFILIAEEVLIVGYINFILI